MIFSVLKKIGFLGILGPPFCGIGATIHIGRDMLCLLYAGFFFINVLFKASALWADAFYKSKRPSVCPCVCPSVCVFTFEVPFKRLFAPTSQSRMSNIFRIRIPWGKVVERNGLIFEHFCLKVV